MAHSSLNEAVAQWVNDHTWPPGAGPSPTILVIPAASSDGTKFEFHSGFSYFQVVATYDKATDSLSDVSISLVAPTYAKSIVVATAASYSLSTSQGEDIPFNLDGGYVTGKVSFKYGTGDTQHILATYEANLPYAGQLQDTLDIAPTEATEGSGLKPGNLKAIKAVETYKAEKALLPPPVVSYEEQALFVKHLKDFTVEGSKGLAVVTYYEGLSLQYGIDIYIPPCFELVGSIDPSTFSFSATFYAVLPWPVGRVKLAGISGSLINGVEVSFDVAVANGKIKLWVEKDPASGHHVLYISGSGWVLIYGDWHFGPLKLIELPF